MISTMIVLAGMTIGAEPAMPRVAVGPKANAPGKLVLVPGDAPFVPWGFNYDHDEKNRLLEDYWETEWPKVEQDFAEMKDLGANVVRIHLQVGKFLNGPDEPNADALGRLRKLLDLAEKTGLYLDLTGLACYRKRDTPEWYDALDETGRWRAQATFWTAVAKTCATSPAVFCYDLMNEPVVTGGPRKPGDWLGPPFGEFCYVQFITLDPKGRPRPEIARQWIETLTRSIRAIDPTRLITVGMVDWSLDRPGLSSGFVPSKVAGPLDFVAVHLYPEAGAKTQAEQLETLRGFVVDGKPVLIEETFPLKCSADEWRVFFKESRAVASGWVGFYWGKTREECKKSGTIGDAMMVGWLDLFRELKP
jgi:Cellulase (glycosyl hydrolase family 5)